MESVNILHSDEYNKRKLVSALGYNFRHQVLGPPWLIYAIRPGADVEPWIYLALWKLKDRAHGPDFNTTVLAVASFQELIPKHLFSLRHKHPDVSWKSVCHPMVVSEDGFTVRTPEFVPHGLWVYTTRVDEPLGIIVQCHVDGVRAPLVGSKQQRLDDSRHACNAGAANLLAHNAYLGTLPRYTGMPHLAYQ